MGKDLRCAFEMGIREKSLRRGIRCLTSQEHHSCVASSIVDEISPRFVTGAQKNAKKMPKKTGGVIIFGLGATTLTVGVLIVRDRS
eukprot:g43355.t1